MDFSTLQIHPHRCKKSMSFFRPQRSAVVRTFFRKMACTLWHLFCVPHNFSSWIWWRELTSTNWLYLHWSGWVAAKIAPGVDEVGKWPDVRSFGKLQQKGSNKTPLFRIFSWANVRKFQYLQPNYNNLAAPGEPTRRRDKHVDEIWCIFTCCINARISYCRTSGHGWVGMEDCSWKVSIPSVDWYISLPRSKYHSG